MTRLSILAILVVELLIAVPSEGQVVDPCVAYGTLNNPFRSTGYVARDGVDPMICDSKLKTGWYRFVNEVGGKMPETKVDKYHCGTYAPIWMTPPHPTAADGIVDRTACINYNGIQNGCIALAIKVKYCPINETFYVYHLVKPSGCPMAYCAGSGQPCPRGQSGLVPNCTVLIKKDFPFADVPVPSVNYVDDTDAEVTMKCSFDFPTRDNVSFGIQWFVNGRGVAPTTICDNPDESTCNQRFSLLGTSEYKPGDTVRCQIRAKYNTHPENKWTNTVTSSSYFAGIEIQPAYLTITECDVGNVLNRIRLRPTLPIRGGKLDVRFGTMDDFEALRANECEIKLEAGDEHKWTNISVQVSCDNTNQAFAPSSFTFTVTSTHSPLDRFWGFYELTPVVITKIENSVDICTASGDPHYTTFDGKYYDFYRPGDFVLYRNKHRHFEIHTRLWWCGGTVTCNCGVAIRELRDVIVLSSCTENLRSNSMQMKVLITSRGRLIRGTKILVRQQGGYTEYVIRLASGTVVRLQRHGWGNDIEMEAPKFDEGNTEGMCGNFNGNGEDDFIHGGDQQSHANDPTGFGESWRVNASTSLFNTVPLCTDTTCEDTELELNMDRCQCEKRGGAININCSLEIMQFRNMPGNFADRTDAIQDGNRKKRELVYSDDIIYVYDDEEPEQDMYLPRSKRAVPIKMSLDNATEYCRKRILDTDAARVCLELTGVNASNAIQSCAADLQLTGDLNWAESAFGSLKSSCEFQAIKNFSAYDKDENGNFVPPVKIAQNLCPGDCNNNGNCTNGNCVCNKEYVSADCSLRFDEVPQLFRILNKGLCDIRVRPCMRTIVFGKYFLDSENLTCHINEFSVVPGEWVPSNKTKTLNGSQTDLFAIECHLPTPPLNLGNFDVEGTPAAGYSIAVSNNKVHHSQFLKLITFDSVCQECNISHGCSLKIDSCLIKGHCFSEEAPNPKDWCQQCNTSVDQIRWTKRIINFPPNITSPSTRYALLGEDLELQLEGEDPESRPFVISLMPGSPSQAKVTNRGVLLWKPETRNSEKFYFKATDECNASSTFDMTINILTCPCTDKGICRPDPNHPRGSGMYFCECQPGYEGQKCEKEIDECLSSPCVHGNCSDAVNNYSCLCEPGYTDYNCSTEIDECQSSPCIYGNCSDMVNGFSCTCQSGFTGARCENNINDCPPSICGNGTCIDLINNYTCQCNVGFAGTYCDVIIRNCSSDSCFPGVRCIQKTHTISCDPCPTGFTGDGKNCKDIDDCVNVSCQNSGSCVDGINNFTCICQKGYTGKWCEKDIDECANVTCYNNGTCKDGVNSYLCICQEGFTGQHCEKDVDDCVTQPCKNNGTCKDGVNTYSCVCQTGFIGDHCETDIDDCVKQPCKNSGTCKDGVNMYTCVCKTGFTGIDCETDIDDCVSNDCANGATCVDGINQYSCICAEEFTGSFCESEVSTTVATEISGSTTRTSTQEEHVTTEPTTETVTEEHKSDFTFEIRVYKEWDDRLQDKTSDTFMTFSRLLKKEIFKAYSGVPGLKEIKIISMRPGSTVVDFQLIFETKITPEKALAPLKKVTADGKLGSLKVDARSLNPKTTIQDDNKEKETSSNLPLIIGVSVGSFVFVAVVIICLLFHCKRPSPLRTNSRISDGMPDEGGYSKAEKYELQVAKPNVSGSWADEKGQWNEGMD